ncbi:uncharacterized protein LOC111268882 [Varroa jacobsoni]|uniref:uncharacterized protein LOC111268882 n=1 Tax=Varroa jacobsoni TaxID=62625 RepID=UPI000BF3EE67|nr:uncharacterized protein LOC111268882 [Varroa jacobsoni]
MVRYRRGPLAELVNVSCILSRHYDSAGSMCVLRKQKLNEANKRDANETGKRELKQSGRRLTPYLELRNGRFQARLTLRSGRRAESSASLLSSSHSSKYSGVVCLSSTQHKGSDGRKLVLKEGTKWNGVSRFRDFSAARTIAISRIASSTGSAVCAPVDPGPCVDN